MAQQEDIESAELEGFDRWWYQEGSGMKPTEDEDTEEHVHRVSRIAWENGAYKEAEKYQ